MTRQGLHRIAQNLDTVDRYARQRIVRHYAPELSLSLQRDCMSAREAVALLCTLPDQGLQRFISQDRINLHTIRRIFHQYDHEVNLMLDALEPPETD